MNRKDLFVLLVQTGAIIRGRDASGDAISAVRKAAEIPKSIVPEDAEGAAVEFLAWHFRDRSDRPEWLRLDSPVLVRKVNPSQAKFPRG